MGEGRIGLRQVEEGGALPQMRPCDLLLDGVALCSGHGEARLWDEAQYARAPLVHKGAELEGLEMRRPQPQRAADLLEYALRVALDAPGLVDFVHNLCGIVCEHFRVRGALGLEKVEGHLQLHLGELGLKVELGLQLLEQQRRALVEIGCHTELPDRVDGVVPVSVIADELLRRGHGALQVVAASEDEAARELHVVGPDRVFGRPCEAAGIALACAGHLLEVREANDGALRLVPLGEAVAERKEDLRLERTDLGGLGLRRRAAFAGVHGSAEAVCGVLDDAILAAGLPGLAAELATVIVRNVGEAQRVTLGRVEDALQ
mmetsp:Transcript_5590/g.15611  ORF Transcript_5590/g.15611 Transcript_5590/m.15611 type:complete len:318 (+) Transcript_5590:2196-3149(+)